MRTNLNFFDRDMDIYEISISYVCTVRYTTKYSLKLSRLPISSMWSFDHGFQHV